MSSAMKLGTCNVSEVVSMDAEKVPQLQYLLTSPTLGHSIPSACFYLQGLDGVLPLFLDRCGGSVEGQVKRDEDSFFHHGIFEKIVPFGGRLYYLHTVSVMQSTQRDGSTELVTGSGAREEKK